MEQYLRELRRRNVFRAVAAYIVLGWILLQASTSLEEALNLPDWFDALVTALLAIGFPVVAVFSWVYELTPDGLQKTSSVPETESVTPRTGRRLDYITAAGVFVLLGSMLYDRLNDRSAAEPAAEIATASGETLPPAATAHAARDKSIAVLPFVAMTTSQDDEFFADGLSEEILNVLAKVEGLKVAGRTSAFYYKGRNEDLREIAGALGVAHILEGSIRRSGERLRVTAQLIKADDGFHLWSETYDRTDGDTFVIQDEIASNVARALQAEILGAVLAADQPEDRNVEAENLYLIAQAAMAGRSLADTRRARDLYAQAAVIDPGNPKYLAGYAAAVALQYWNFRDILAEEAITEASSAIERALSLGEPSAGTLAIAGLVEELRASTASDLAANTRARAYYEEAVAKDPNNVLALQWLASIYLDINEPAKSRETFEKVVELDPLNTLALTGLANALAGLGLHDEAREHLFRLQSLFPDVSSVYRYLGGIEYQTGRHDKHLYWLNRAIDLDPSPLEISFAIYAYILIGWADQALDAAERYRRSADGVDVSRLVQAELDRDFDALAMESKAVYAKIGEAHFAMTGAWADTIAGRCGDAIPVLERQYPSLKGEVIEYLDSDDLMDAVLLAHCHAATNNRLEAQRLTDLVLTARMLSADSVEASPGLRLVRVAAQAVAGDIAGAIAELEEVSVGNAPLGVSRIALPIDELPVFEGIADEAAFRQYARQVRFELARQARMLAAGETEQEIAAQMEAAGFELDAG